MDASVKRHEEKHVRQVGSEDPEQRGGSDQVDKSDTQSDNALLDIEITFGKKRTDNVNIDHICGQPPESEMEKRCLSPGDPSRVAV